MVQTMSYVPKGMDWFFFANGLILVGLMLAASVVFLMYVDGYFTREQTAKRKQDGKK